MNAEQKDLSLIDEDAETIVGGRAVGNKSRTSLRSEGKHPGYVPGDTGVVEPASSGMAGADPESSSYDC